MSPRGRTHHAAPWFWKPISETCQVQEHLGRDCGKPTIAGYQAMGGGYMALCSEHAPKHRLITQPVEDCRRNVPFPMAERFPAKNTQEKR
jgi:hypothetical protein